jgi:hypothetical protein
MGFRNTRIEFQFSKYQSKFNLIHEEDIVQSMRVQKVLMHNKTKGYVWVGVKIKDISVVNYLH